MDFRNTWVRAAIAAVFASTMVPAAASADVTYHFAQGPGSYNTGVFVGTPGPFTFDFTVANVLAPNRSYGFGVAGVESGYDGNVIDLLVTGGNALSTFTLADYKGASEYFYGYINGGTLSRINVDTDSTGKISAFVMHIRGRSPGNSTLVYQADISSSGMGALLWYAPELGYFTPVAGRAGCAGSCGVIVSSHVGGITGAGGGGGGGGIGAVPEPATWALMIVGFGLVGSIWRRQLRGLVTVAA